MQQANRTLYSFDKTEKLVAMLDDVQDLPVMEVLRVEKIQYMLGRHVDISKHGRAVCSSCRCDLGDRPGIAPGLLSHGFCEQHNREMLERI